MTPKTNHDVKYLIINTLQNKIFADLNKARTDFIISGWNLKEKTYIVK